MRKIKLMADYDCYPLWEIFSDGMENIAPSSLLLPKSLAVKLDLWGEKYDKTMNQEDPSTSGFGSNHSLAAFEIEGKALYGELKQELGDDFIVTYFSGS